MATTTAVKRTTTKAVPKAETAKVTVKKYSDTDKIPCVSVTYGELCMVGDRSKDIYDWVDYGDIQDVEVRDLKYIISQKSSFIFKPRFVIKDEEFVAQYKAVADFYKTLYEPHEIYNMLDLDADELNKFVKGMPDGYKDAVKGIAMGRINDGTLDSVQKVKILDDVLGTSMLSALVG